MSNSTKKIVRIVLEVAKYAIGAVLGWLGTSCTNF